MALISEIVFNNANINLQLVVLSLFLEPAQSDTLRNKGSKRVPPEGLKFYPEPFVSEEPFFEERVCQGFFMRPFPLTQNQHHSGSSILSYSRIVKIPKKLTKRLSGVLARTPWVKPEGGNVLNRTPR